MNLLEALGTNGEYNVKQGVPHCEYKYLYINNGALRYNNGQFVSITANMLLATDWQRVPKQPEVPDGYRLMTDQDKVIPRGRKYWSNQWVEGSDKVGAKYHAVEDASICPIEGSWTWARIAMDAGLKVENCRWGGYPQYWYKENETYKCVRANGEIKNILIDYKVMADGWQLYTEPKPTQEEVSAARDKVINAVAEWYDLRIDARQSRDLGCAYQNYIELKSKLEKP